MSHDYGKIFQRLIDLHDQIDEVADSVAPLINEPEYYNKEELEDILDDVRDLLGDL